MTHSFDGYNYMIRLECGKRLAAAVEQFLREVDLAGGWVSDIGSASEVTLGFYELERQQYKWRTLTRPLEIASLAGNLAADEQGAMTCHLHGVFADEQYRTVGGHVRDLVAGATVELFVHRSFRPVRRTFDGATGLALLDLGRHD